MEIKEGGICFQDRGNRVSTDTEAWWVHLGAALRMEREGDLGSGKEAEEIYSVVRIRLAWVPSDSKNLCFHD